MHIPLVVIILSLLSGTLGRMGGSGRPFKTWMRDWTIPALFLFTLHLLSKPTIDFRLYLIYLIIYILMGFSFTTYFDWLFNGWDCLWFSGGMVGLSTIPCMLLGINMYSILVRATLLAIIWGLLNRYIPNKVLIWRRDVVEEFLRYASVIATIPILLI